MSVPVEPIRWVVVGATGAVGREVLAVLLERGVPITSIRAVASERSAGGKIAYGSGELMLEDSRTVVWQQNDVVILGADAATAKQLVPQIVAAGGIAVDNSSAYRMDPRVPLVVPEVNPEALPATRHGMVIANPNCSTILLLVALEPLRRAFGLERVVVSTYQAVSGAGIAAMDELRDQTRDVLDGKPAQPRVFHEPCAFNLFSHDSSMDVATGFNGEESKVIDESRKILKAPNLPITPTCVRVPVLRAHTQSVCVTLSQSASLAEVQRALDAGAGLRVQDDRAANRFPTPQQATGRDEVLVGRVRPADVRHARSGESTREFCLLLAGDQLRKGAALNAVQIAELMLQRPRLERESRCSSARASLDAAPFTAA